MGLMNWIKSKFVKSEQASPKMTADCDDPVKRFILLETWKTNQTMMGRVDDKGNVHISYSDGQKKIMTPEDIDKYNSDV